MNLYEALSIIGMNLGAAHDELCEGLPLGSNSEWGYDEKLVIEIAEAIQRWEKRKAD